MLKIIVELFLRLKFFSKNNKNLLFDQMSIDSKKIIFENYTDLIKYVADITLTVTTLFPCKDY